MTQLDLRPLTTAEIIDRSFTLFRRHFLLFVGIAAVPQVFVLAIQLGRIYVNGAGSSGNPAFNFSALTLAVAFVAFVVTYVAALFSQAATIYAVSNLYLNRPNSVSDCLRRAWGEIGTLFGVGILVGLCAIPGLLVFIVGALYVACRLMVAVPAAIVEQRGPREAVSRSWNLTKENAGRAFLLLLFYMVIGIIAALVVAVPVGIAGVFYKDNPSLLQFWTIISQVVGTLLNVITVPILLILSCVFYFDLRVRKEAFDLQFLMDPTSERLTPPGSGSIPSIL